MIVTQVIKISSEREKTFHPSDSPLSHKKVQCLRRFTEHNSEEDSVGLTRDNVKNRNRLDFALARKFWIHNSEEENGVLVPYSCVFANGPEL